MSKQSPVIPYKISVLVFLKDTKGRHLLLLRNKTPNQNKWSPIGGKLEMPLGESPYECAIRETAEETQHTISLENLHLFAMIAEKAYEGTGHWLMFLFICNKPLENLPEDIDEGKFRFFSREEIDTLPLPETDRQALWPTYDQYKDSFVTMRADCSPGKPLDVIVEETIGGQNSPIL
ncbi:MAG: NUDIX domain-containing protein [Opitutaceae bacterium]|nr:NUDIX domain-containing protein [Opitutaceae bacterium]